ncbi:MAG TPA: hypothetical protein VHU81_02715 [Thermoanaerobaculia bacterium]|jgi:hypothetical protein|nr:hypothetical protein [Thermoanaerobaculia bacterium]
MKKMMKKARKIQLSRETLIHLNGSRETDQIATDSYCSPDCIDCTSWGMGYDQQEFGQMICPQLPY